MFEALVRPAGILEGVGDGPTTPVAEQSVRAFFEGLAALAPTLARGQPGAAALAISPSLRDLIAQFCGADPRYGRVMANTWIRVGSNADIKFGPLP